MTDVEIALTFDPNNLASYTGTYLATLWHLAQANPAPHGDRAAGEVAEKIGREIIRRWLGAAQPELYCHQGRDYYWSQLCKVARYEPGGPSGSPEWHNGQWVPRATDETPDAER